MIGALKANILAAIKNKKIKKKHKAEIEKTYAKEIKVCEQAIKEAIKDGRKECIVRCLELNYDVAREIEWYLEQFGYYTGKERNLNGPGYNIIIKWYD